ncbi:MAG: hypothetical protein K2W96_02180, partial [Gemmataceae bacterium]|nr:hypothetical protein [Gemmataceae bacterium]
MVGAVFHQEMMLAGRRFSLHALRWAYGGWLVLQVAWFYIDFQGKQFGRGRPTPFGLVEPRPASALEPVGARFAEAFLAQQGLLLLLLVPACVAGAVTDEKRKGTLQHLLLTDLESRHLIVGKMLARVLQVLLVLVAGLPLFALMAGFGGLPPISIAVAAASLVLPLVGLSAMTLLASVWCRQTRDAVLGLYAAFGLLALLAKLVGFLRPLDPAWVLEPAWGPAGGHDLAEALSRLALGGTMWGVLAAACLFLAATQLRPFYIAEMQDSGRGKAAWYAPAREPISDQPVEWRERHVEGLAPNAFLRAIPQWLGIALVAVLTTASCLLILAFSLVKGATMADLCRAILSLDVLRIADLMPEA